MLRQGKLYMWPQRLRHNGDRYGYTNNITAARRFKGWQGSWGEGDGSGGATAQRGPGISPKSIKKQTSAYQHHREGGRLQGWEQVCWGAFQDIDSPKRTILFQDLKDSGILIFQDALRFQQMIFQTVRRCHAHPTLFKKHQRCSTNISDLAGFT